MTAGTKRDPGPFEERNTDLDKFSHGNFDVEYVPRAGELRVVIGVRYLFEEGISDAAKAAVKFRMQEAIQVWDGARVTLKTNDPNALNPRIRVRFRVEESATPHKIIDVEKDYRRPWVGMDLNCDPTVDTTTLAHELGHILGNYDEYEGQGVQSWIEERMWWHDNHYVEDTSAMMNSGQGMRARYFDHFQRFVNEKFAPLGIVYHIELGTASAQVR